MGGVGKRGDPRGGSSPNGGSLAGPERGPRWGGDSGADPEDMEGEEAPSWRGPGGAVRELCRSFGHYNRHLARLQHNLRETKRFFRDVKYCQGHPFGDGPPSAGDGDGGPGDGGERGAGAGGEAGLGRGVGGRGVWGVKGKCLRVLRGIGRVAVRSEVSDLGGL